MKQPGWRVHTWQYPVIWWARRKPRSRFRQRLWDGIDWIDWYFVIRRRRNHRD